MTGYEPDAIVTDLAIAAGKRAATRWRARDKPTDEDQQEIIAQEGGFLAAELEAHGYDATVISDVQLTMCEIFQRELEAA